MSLPQDVTCPRLLWPWHCGVTGTGGAGRGCSLHPKERGALTVPSIALTALPGLHLHPVPRAAFSRSSGLLSLLLSRGECFCWHFSVSLLVCEAEGETAQAWFWFCLSCFPWLFPLFIYLYFLCPHCLEVQSEAEQAHFWTYPHLLQQTLPGSCSRFAVLWGPCGGG